MDYIIVKCRYCRKWNHVVVTTQWRDATELEKTDFNKAAGPERKRVSE